MITVRGSTPELRLTTLANLELRDAERGIRVYEDLLTRSANLIIRSVRVAGTGAAMTIAGPHVVARVHDSVIEQNASGIFADRNVELRVTDTLIADNGKAGLGLNNGSRAVVRDSTIRGHTADVTFSDPYAPVFNVGITVGHVGHLRLMDTVVENNGSADAGPVIANAGIVAGVVGAPSEEHRAEEPVRASLEPVDGRIVGNHLGVLVGARTALTMTGSDIRGSASWGLAAFAPACVGGTGPASRTSRPWRGRSTSAAATASRATTRRRASMAAGTRGCIAPEVCPTARSASPSRARAPQRLTR